jgi:hypothetical protein
MNRVQRISPFILVSAFLVGTSSAADRPVIVGEPKEAIAHALYVKVLGPEKLELTSRKWR